MLFNHSSSFVFYILLFRMAAQHVTPFFRSPFTDLTGAMVNAQHYHACGPMELQMMECLEAYGTDKGKIKCRDIIDDFQECFSRNKQQMRFVAMRMERHRQWFNGDRKEHYQTKTPRVDSL